MLRSMAIEFEDDLACAYLDRQYMLGEALLIAPVFSPEGDADYYLPEGLWTSLLDSSVQEGGKWRHGNYDYFSLPLYVRENTLLVLGTCQDRPDYPYPLQSELHIYQPSEGAEISARIPDLSGQTVHTVTAVRTGGRLHIAVTGSHKGFRVVVHCKTETAEASLCAGTSEISVPLES